ncbi:hypothetical protein [Paenilisteria rocourtiae]|uniref:Uncharacterized protein n=1 Tax=Listeria rocourtiae TaxID=647910 RepID=A0A4R6ZRH5_9LIST|nr:hypothetical protein [Listeria rocourtiae]EUJ44402.1 hypothetical protein PROCOU_13903 [Listeria rocourtiae FSL F6-920]TDR55118.1 hypothetical protein DFP96_10146 [Listeria rocourtiae]
MANIKVRVIDGIVDGVHAGKDVTIDEVHVARLVKAGFIAEPTKTQEQPEDTTPVVQEKAPAKKASTKKKAD